MLRLITLGSLGIFGESGADPDKKRANKGQVAVASVATQRKPMALLSVIAAGGARGVSREQVLLYLWPESGADNARNTLNQTLYALRRNLGEPNLFLTGNTLRLNPQVISCDHWDFENALIRRELETAARLYTGPFMQTFELAAVPELDRWIDAERDRLAQRYFQALVTLATRCADKGDYRQAADWWRCLTAQEPLSALAAAGLITAMAAGGDRPAAIAFARQYETLIKSELNLPLEPEVAKLVAHLEDTKTSSVPLLTASQVSQTLNDWSGFERFTKPFDVVSNPPDKLDQKPTVLTIDKHRVKHIDLQKTGGAHLYETIVENAADIIYCADMEGYFTYANKAAEKLLGLPQSEIIGQLYVNFIRDDFRHEMIEMYMRQVMDRIPLTYYEFPVAENIGTAMWLGQHVQLMEANGTPVGILAIARDITLRKRLERSQEFFSVREKNTKLLNAAAFKEMVTHRMSLARRTRVGFLLLFVRVENMEEVATRNGPTAAELMAKLIAGVLRGSFRDSDIIARLRPEEFAVVALEAGEKDTKFLHDRLDSKLQELNQLERASVLPLLRITAAYFDPQFPTSVETLFATIAKP